MDPELSLEVNHLMAEGELPDAEGESPDAEGESPNAEDGSPNGRG